MEILKVQNLHKSFGGVHAIDHCSFSVEQNSITGLIGPNGAGKTTMFDLINGLMLPDEGHVYIKNQNVTSWPTHKRARLGLTRTFQAIRVFPELSALENVVVAFSDHPEKMFQAFLPLKKKRRDLEKRAMEYLKTVGIGEKASLRAGDLSYGQQKLLEIARCMATDADIFLLDEPAAGINPTLLNTIKDLILKLHGQGKTLLIVEHNMPFLMSISHKIIVLNFGKELAIGKPDEIQNNPHVLEAYLGKRREE